MLEPEVQRLVDAVMRPECVTTPETEARHCKGCGEEFTPGKFHPKQRYCSRACQNNVARDMSLAMQRELKKVAKQVAYSYLNRDRYLSFDGKYEGPLNKSVTVVVTLRKDKGFHPMPIDVHVKPVEQKFNSVTPEDVDWGRRQARPAQNMPRHFDSFCASCVEMIVDSDKREVRVTKGVYLPVEHKCGCVRVYDLRGNLLEVKL